MTLKLVILIFAMATADASRVFGQPALVAQKVVPSLLPGQNRLLLIWTNNSVAEVDTEIKGTLFAASSTLAVRLPIHFNERLRLLPNQASLMPVTIELPDVRGKTLFVIQWQDAARKIIGTVELHVYPREILRQLASIEHERSIGLISGDETFKKAFTNGNVKFEEIQPDQVRDFSRELLILNGFPTTNAVLRGEIVALAKRGVVVVWISQGGGQDDVLRPNLFMTPYGSGAVVFVQEQFVENFAENAESQLRLVEICRVAAKPGRPGLPIIFSKDRNEN